MTDKIRLTEKLKINEEIRMNTRYNEMDTTALLRFRGLNASDKYVCTQIEKMTNAISLRISTIQEFTERISKLERGELDEELTSMIRKNTTDTKEKGNATIIKKREEKLLDAEDAKKSKNYYDKERKNDKQDKEWYYDSAERHFNKSCDNIPEYMTRELKKMPSNHGYIWRGVYFFGGRNPTSNTEFKMTENQKGKKIITHWNTTYISVYETNGSKGVEKLISRTVRKKKI